MRAIINYIRQVFCKHDFVVEEQYTDFEVKSGTRVYMRCKKCGYHTSHWKFI